MQVWPALSSLPRTIRSTARGRSQSACTMAGDLPPSFLRNTSARYSLSESGRGAVSRQRLSLRLGMVTATAGERSMAGWRGLFAWGASRGAAKTTAEAREAEGLVQPAALALPGPQEAITVQLGARTLAEIAPLLRLPGVRLAITADRHL